MATEALLSKLIYTVQPGETITVRVNLENDWSPKLVVSLDGREQKMSPGTKENPEFVFAIPEESTQSHFLGVLCDFGNADYDDRCRFDGEGTGPGQTTRSLPPC